MVMSRPLVVAVTAMALLVASVGFEVLFHRTYQLDVRTDDGWMTIGTSGDPYGVARPRETQGGGVVRASSDDTLTFRLRVDNGYPWSMSEAYDVRVGGVIVAEGTIAAAGRGDGESTFTVRAATLFSQSGRSPDVEGKNITFAYVDVAVERVYLSGTFQLEEVA